MRSAVTTGAILFTDMSDSTALRSRLGEDRADRLREDHDNLLRATIESNNGTVLRWTGDGVKAGFASASDAVGAAVEIQRAVADYGSSPQAQSAFQVRIGLSAGELTIDEGGDHRGLAVIEAARLEALARPGEILATDIVRVLGGRRSLVAFEELGERGLKGLDRPVTVHRVVDLGTAAGPPIPPFLSLTHRFPMIGRDEAVATCQRSWDDARLGNVRAIVVKGESGIGKTRLVSHVAELAHRTGGLVIAGACSSDVAVPYESFAAAVRPVTSLDEPLAHAVSTGVGALGRLFPLAKRSADGGPTSTATRLELFDEVVALFGRLATTAPVMLVLEDLHWSNEETIALLDHLLANASHTRLLIVATSRDGELGPRHPLKARLATWRSDRGVDLIELAGLDEAAVGQLVGAAAPTAPITDVAALAALVHSECAGNPFFASEVLHHLSTTGQLDAPGALARGGVPIPQSIHDVVLGRLADQEDGTYEALRSAAVIGPAFDLEVLADVLARDPDDLLDLLEGAAKASILTEVGVERFAFTHAIVRAALLDELGPTRLARAHRKVAEALERRGGDQFDELARHWQRAGDEQRSNRYLVRAARRDMDAFAFESARARYQQVIDQLERDPHAAIDERSEAWLGLGSAMRSLMDADFVTAVTRGARLAKAARNPALIAEAAALSSWLGAAFYAAEAPNAELIGLCEDALTLVSDSEPIRVRILATLASHLTFSIDRESRRALIDEAVQLAGRHDDPLLTAAVLHAEFSCLWDPATRKRREQITRELSRIARATGDIQIEFTSAYFATYLLLEQGELDAAERQCELLRPIAAATRASYPMFLADRLPVTLSALRSKPDAQDRLDALLDRWAPTQPDASTSWTLQTGLLAYQAGTFGQMLPAMSAMTTGAQSRMWTSAQALAMLWSGDTDGAEELLDQSWEVPMNYFWMGATQAYAEVAVELGRVDHCQRLFDELAPFRGMAGVTGSGSGCFGLASRTLGMLAVALADYTEAIELLQSSAAHADRVDFTFERVTSRRHLADALQATGDDAEASRLRAEAIDIATAHGFSRELDLLTRP